MYPYGNIGHSSNQGAPSGNSAFQTPGYGYTVNQQAQYYQVQQQSVNYGTGASCGPQQMQHPPPRPAMMQLQFNAEEERQRRYKLEQQRKFKDFGKTYKNTSIDVMLSSIVTSTEKKLPTQPVKKEPDDFGEFLQATPVQASRGTLTTSTPSNFQNIPIQKNSSILHSDKKLTTTTTNQSSTASSKPNVDLHAKMMSSLDMNQSQHAYLKFTPVAAPTAKRPDTKKYQPSTKAADWSSLTSVEDAFVVEQQSIIPDVASPQPVPAPASSSSWVTDVTQAPIVYKHVYEASVAPDGMMDTAKLYPILLQCNLPNQTLGHLWSMVNQTVPGKLTQKELFVLLALIALTQSGQSSPDIESVLKLLSPPVPFLSAYSQIDQSSNRTEEAKESRTLHSRKPELLAVKSVEDDFDDFQGFQSDSTKPDTTAKLPPPSLPLTSTTIAPVNWTSPSTVTTTQPPLISPIVPPSASPKKPSHQESTSITTIKKPTLSFNPQSNQSSLLATADDDWSDFTLAPATNSNNQTDEYAAFSSLNMQTNGWDAASSFTAPSSTAESTSVFPVIEPPSYSSVSQSNEIHFPEISTLNPSTNMKSFAAAAATDISVTPSSNSIMNEGIEWKIPFSSSLDNKKSDSVSTPFPVQYASAVPSATFKSEKPQDASLTTLSKNNSFTLQSDSNSVKSLELHSISQVILQRSIGTFNSADNQEPVPAKSPRKKYGPSFCDDDYNMDDFIEPPPDTPGDAFDEFDEFQEGNSTLMDFDAFAHFEEPKKSQASQLQTSKPTNTTPTSTIAQNLPIEDPDDFVLSPVSSETSIPVDNHDFLQQHDIPGVIQQHDVRDVVQQHDVRDVIQQHDVRDVVQQHDVRDVIQQHDVRDVIQQHDVRDVIQQHDVRDVIQQHVVPGEKTFNLSKEERTMGAETPPASPVNASFEVDFNAIEVMESRNSNATTSTVDSSSFQAFEAVIENTRHKENKYESIEILDNDLRVSPASIAPSEIHAKQWGKCLKSCNDVISKTNEILSSIGSPAVCREVVHSIKGQRLISDLSEVHGVARRIFCSMRRLKIEDEELQQLQKQMELTWHNLLAFCPNATVIDPDIASSDVEATCGVCLIRLRVDKINYAGRDYHPTCANFWVNCVNSLLPALS